jgi:glyoxylase-like metal-dependent hydrolase (beta-lactamase superfamily II)/8-oxo-dGTP pyrophosphatase MutT (NUDIX family)
MCPPSWAARCAPILTDVSMREANPSPTVAQIPKDAAAVILLQRDTNTADPVVFLVRRSEKLAFLGGYYAFPGGQLDPSDALTRVETCAHEVSAAMISCAARELFEELGVLVARSADTLTKGQRASLLDDLESGRMSWAALLQHYGLYLDASDFTFVGRWVTPPFSPRRFDTWFFIVNCPSKQDPHVIPGELESGEWTSARKAYQRWQGSELLAAPPVIHGLRTLADGLTTDLVERFLSVPHAHRETVRRIEFRPNYICFPVQTPTKPPATHTNCYLIYNSRAVLIIDPASPYEEEQSALAACVDDLLSEGRTLLEIVLTHMHPDHVGGVNALKAHLGNHLQVAAHRLTAQSLRESIRVDRLIEDGHVITLGGSPEITLQALHTPGHARGHLCFYEARTGTMISGDNIVGFGSVLIDPPEGNMGDYLTSLKRMRALPNLSVIFGGHGPAIANPYTKIDDYIAHRLEREENILKAVREGATTPKEIVARVYTDVTPNAHAMAERAVIAHLEKLEGDKLVSSSNGVWYVKPVVS